ncbi:universal stress protein [Natronorubrum thiooxidans]|uniref:Nucleotide-binding universal stress protein, UspA family n=1 Tax=Natronorubrum thiooxidans TaxID=308853 RepID=A0A1N7DFT0_9EURY|nr:universal stress protein [Natronorubrum thiooxidans]SIR74713.1 Nucleotide-binding universal stress protein, UspA family [Natronorubrum thiooxidans]
MDRVLVAIDDSREARDALKYALEQFSDATIHVIHVPEVPSVSFDMAPDSSMTDQAEDQAADILESAREIASERGRTVETDVVFGHPAKATISYAEDNDIEQIIVGSRGKGGMKRVLLGSVAETIIRRADCPVTVVR